ncbi:hypothetical protein V5799_024038 [Amblyomma americanum]|uniref:Uncharacterized protein n=1 Tax=Amblyomma americanum TaxID=6943 RepID=A0AAQ4EDJ1_AMBAM
MCGKVLTVVSVYIYGRAYSTLGRFMKRWPRHLLQNSPFWQTLATERGYDSWRQGLRFKAKFERMKLRLASGESNAPKKRRTAPDTPTIHRASRSSADTAATACYPAVMHEGEHVLEATKFCVLRSKHY